MYGYIRPETGELANKFLAEAERLWAVERELQRDSYNNIAAAEFLCLGYLGQGKDHAIIAYIHATSEMGKRMGLFGYDFSDIREDPQSAEMTDEGMRAKAFAAWGIFNWLT
jgi:hypothetical protein